MGRDRGSLFWRTLLLGQGKRGRDWKFRPSEWADAVRHTQPELGQLVLAVHVLLRNGDGQQAAALHADVVLRLEYCFMWFAELRRDGPAGLVVAVDRPADGKAVLAEVGGGVLQLDCRRLRQIAFRCERDFELADDEIAVRSAAGAAGR